jgi:anti-anti-sigma factor
VFPTSQLYDLSRPIDPAEQLAIYDRAVRAAIDSGFDGIRVAADITSLVADPGRRLAHVHWEQVADRYIARQPLAPLCLYDATRIRSLDVVVCVHPLRHAGAADAKFGVWSGADGVIVLEGEIDGLTSPVLSDVLAGLPHGGSRDAIDVSALRFLDGRSAFILHDALRRRRAAGHDVVLAGANEQLRRLSAMCGFDDTWFAAA